MEIFFSALNQIAVLFAFIFIGYILRRLNVLPQQTATVFSRIENKIFMPAVVINTFWTNCTVKNISEKWTYILYSTVILLFCIGVAFLVSRFLSKTPYIKKIYRYSLCVSNFGFVGTAMMSGIYGAESIELFDYMIFTLPLNFFTYSLGIAWLVPEENESFSLKSFINPIFISLFIGGIMGLVSIPKYKILNAVISSAANCMSPVAMILTGFVIAGFALKDLFRQKQTYVVALIRLILLPSLLVFVLRLIKAPEEIVAVTLCANAMPLGLNTVIIPSAYGKNPEAGASMALVSQLTAVVSIPILFYLFL